MVRCPHCAAELETPLACAACGRLLALESELSPFEIFGLPVAFEVDAHELRKRLLRFSRSTHPDFFGTAPAAEKARAECASARLNSAHETLSDDVRRADWLIAHLGGPDESAERQMPQTFLMEVLEWNELLDLARKAPAETDARNLLDPLETSLRLQREHSLRAIAKALDPIPERPERNSPQLRDARRQLNAVRYFDRTLREIEALRLSKSANR